MRTGTTSDGAPPPISMCCLPSVEDGSFGHFSRTWSAHLARLPGLECAPTCTSCRACRCFVWPRTSARKLDADFHEQRRWLLRSVLSVVPSRGGVWQTDG